MDQRADTHGVEMCLDHILRSVENGDEDNEYEDKYEDESNNSEGSSTTPVCANDHVFERVRDVLEFLISDLSKLCKSILCNIFSAFHP